MKDLKQYGQMVAMQNDRFVKRYIPIVQKALQFKVDDVKAIVKEKGIAAAISHISTDLVNPELIKAIQSLYKTVGLFHARQNERRLRNETGKKSTVFVQMETKDFSYVGDWLATILEYLKRYMLDKLTFKVNATQRAELLNVLNEAETNGWGLDKTVNQLDNLPFTRMQAERIIRTEVTRATGAGTRAQAQTFAYETQKTWIAVHDFRTRGVNPKDKASHIGMDGQTVDENDYFTDPRNGNLLRFPGDPDAEAEDVINCRCVAATIAKRDENGKLIPKQKQPSRISVILPGQLRKPVAITI